MRSRQKDWPRLSFLTDDYDDVQAKARTMASDVTVFDAGVPGVDLFFCTMGGVPMEFMGSYGRRRGPGGVRHLICWAAARLTPRKWGTRSFPA